MHFRSMALSRSPPSCTSVKASIFVTFSILPLHRCRPLLENVIMCPCQSQLLDHELQDNLVHILLNLRSPKLCAQTVRLMDTERREEEERKERRKKGGGG